MLALVRGPNPVIEVRCDAAVAVSVTAMLDLYSARAGISTPAVATCAASHASCAHRAGTLLSTTLSTPVTASVRAGQIQAISLHFLQMSVLRRLARLDHHALVRLAVSLRPDGLGDRGSHILGAPLLPPACDDIDFTGPPPGTGAVSDVCSGSGR